MTIMIPTWVDGELTPVEKMDAHIRGLRHKAVSVFVLQGDNVLIQRRALEKYHTPGLWANTCCTHPEWEEPALDCAIRRLDEELGINGLEPVFRDRIEYRADVGNGLMEHEVVDLFTAEAPETLSFTPNPDEVMDTRWMTFRELHQTVIRFPNRFTPWLRIYLEEHSASIFGATTS
ncbi:MAG: isopentenyl-diphosphate Delta-isomerase [Pseudomonadota bacterium]